MVYGPNLTYNVIFYIPSAKNGVYYFLMIIKKIKYMKQYVAYKA